VLVEDTGTEGPTRSQLPIISPEPRYNRISGFASRQQRQSMRMSLSAAQMHNLMDISTQSQGDFKEFIFSFFGFLCDDESTSNITESSLFLLQYNDENILYLTLF
jgi:hypothetical protein